MMKGKESVERKEISAERGCWPGPMFAMDKATCFFPRFPFFLFPLRTAMPPDGILRDLL
jgi:hypothetical protein